MLLNMYAEVMKYKYFCICLGLLFHTIFTKKAKKQTMVGIIQIGRESEKTELESA